MIVYLPLAESVSQPRYFDCNGCEIAPGMLSGYPTDMPRVAQTVMATRDQATGYPTLYTRLLGWKSAPRGEAAGSNPVPGSM